MIESNMDSNVERVVSPTAGNLAQFENQLRPKSFREYIGQEQIKENLGIAISAAKKREEALDHVLLHGAPGLGKTTLAALIADEVGAGLKITSGPALDKAGDIASIISNLQENDVLFIDEIHRLKPVVEETLYTAMEDFGIDIIIGKGPSARSMRINLPRFTLVGATTKLSMLSSPLRSRFGSVFKLNAYQDEEIMRIIERSASLLGVEFEPAAAAKLAAASRSTPRIANRLLKRVRDYAEVLGNKLVTMKTLNDALNALGIDQFGLDPTDRELLAVIIEKFNGGPVGLNTIAAATSEEAATIEDIYEPFLIQLGMLERTPRGRITTKRAYDHLGIPLE